jgi:hypothetical protein
MQGEADHTITLKLNQVHPDKNLEVYNMAIDILIRSWGTPQSQGYPAWWQWYRSPDVFVDNDGNRVAKIDASTVPNFKYYDNVDLAGEPCIGMNGNRLFAVVRNIGNTNAQNVKAAFSYCPFGSVGGINFFGYFKLIAEVYFDLSANEEKEIEVPWDLSDLSENNGGQWPAPLSNFSNFCVNVLITHKDSVKPTQLVQHNFKNVISVSQFVPDSIIVANNDRETKLCEIVAPKLPSGWRLLVRGLDQGILNINSRAGARFKLEPGERKVLTMTIMAGEMGDESTPVEVSMLMNSSLVGGFSLLAKKMASMPTMRRRVTQNPSRFIRRSMPSLVRERS